MKTTIVLALLAGLLAIATTATAQPLPQAKIGSCPSGYRDSGGYGAPMSDRAPIAVPKVGACPNGFVQSGARPAR